MNKYFTKKSDVDAFIAAIEILEMQGDNEVIEQIKNDTQNALRGMSEDGHLHVDWVIMLVMRARQQVRKKKSGNQ